MGLEYGDDSAQNYKWVNRKGPARPREVGKKFILGKEASSGEPAFSNKH